METEEPRASAGHRASVAFRVYGVVKREEEEEEATTPHEYD